MTLTLESLSRRMTTLQSVRSIVRTMKTLSAINAAPYEAAAISIERFHATIFDGLHILLRTAGHPDVNRQSSKSPGIMIVFGSDHGLCGGYNDAVADGAAGRIGKEKWSVLSVGAKAAQALADRGIESTQSFRPPASTDGIGRLASEVIIAVDEMRDATKGEEPEVLMTYMALNKGGGPSITVAPLLPINSELLSNLAQERWLSRSLPVIMMPTDTLFAALVRNHLFASVFRASAEAMATENAARLALMQQAERAVDDQLAQLLFTTRSVRQSEITNELLDVISGFEVLKNRNYKSPDPSV